MTPQIVNTLVFITSNDLNWNYKVCLCVCVQPGRISPKTDFFLKKSPLRMVHVAIVPSQSHVFLAAVSRWSVGCLRYRTKRRKDHSVPPEASPVLIGQQEILLFWLSRVKSVTTHLMNDCQIFSAQSQRQM